jgi:hypothetical protein
MATVMMLWSAVAWGRVRRARRYQEQTTVAAIVWEVLQRHAAGIRFRERRAGSALDSHMAWDGFEVTASVRWSDGTGYRLSVCARGTRGRLSAAGGEGAD